jgi:hypothetical protein
MHKTAFIVGIRLAFGVLTLVAIILQAIHVYQAGAFVPLNYFGYFTNVSNILAACIFIVSAYYVARRRESSRKADLVRGAATLYMAVTGVVYLTLLSGEELGLLMPWVNIVTHIVMPIAVVADWLYRPPRNRLGVQHMLLWLIFPLLYLGYTLVRGAVVHWYPYPFLDPSKVAGYGGVVVYCVVILVAFLAIGWLLTKLSVRLKRRLA